MLRHTHLEVLHNKFGFLATLTTEKYLTYFGLYFVISIPILVLLILSNKLLC